MYLRDLGDSLVRRWYLVIGGIALTIGLSFAASNVVSPTYETTSSLVLVPPRTTTGESGNPYLFLGGLEQSVDVLSRALTSDATRASVAKEVGSGDYEVSADLSTSAPILLVTTSAPTSAGAQKTLDAVVAKVPTVFGRLQSSLGVKSASQITTSVVTTDDAPTANNKSRKRMVALAALASMFLSVVLIGFIDGVLLTRQGRRALEEAQETARADADDATAGPPATGSVQAGRTPSGPRSPAATKAPVRKDPARSATAAREPDGELTELERALQADGAEMSQPVRTGRTRDRHGA